MAGIELTARVCLCVVVPVPCEGAIPLVVLHRQPSRMSLQVKQWHIIELQRKHARIGKERWQERRKHTPSVSIHGTMAPMDDMASMYTSHAATSPLHGPAHMSIRIMFKSIIPNRVALTL